MNVRLGDRVFKATVVGAAVGVLGIVTAIGVFLVVKAIPALDKNTGNFFTEKLWLPDQTEPVFGIAALVFGTLVSSFIALVLAMPVAVGTALFIAHYAPRPIARSLGFLVDLLAAVPSVVYGLWGLYYLKPKVNGVERWLDDWFGFIPIFHNRTGAFGGSLFVAGVILAVMILPIISAITREVFLQVPTAHVEAALALGATKWEAMRTAVFPYGRSGMVGAAMLGLGRALGETIAVALVLSTSFEVSAHLTEPGGNTFAANIANRFAESGQTGVGALIASGLVLFAITLIVNAAARFVVARKPA